jgi:hypothetical protein
MHPGHGSEMDRRVQAQVSGMSRSGVAGVGGDLAVEALMVDQST